MRILLVACLLASGGIASGQAEAGCVGGAGRGFAGAEQSASTDGVQADLRVGDPALPAPASATGASVILFDRTRGAFAQTGWLSQRAGVASSFVAWSLPSGGIAVRTVPRAPVGLLVVYKASSGGGKLAFWFDHVDGAPSVSGIPTGLHASEAQVEAERVGGARLAGSAGNPSVLGWTFVRVAGRWHRMEPGALRADPGLGIRRAPTLFGEAGTHLLVWDRACTATRLATSPSVHARPLSAAGLHDDFGIDLRSTSAATPAVSAARAAAIALAQTHARRVLSTRLARCRDTQLAPSLERTCYAVSLDPGVAARPPIGARDGPPPRPLASLTALIDAASGDLVETVAT